MQLFPKPEQLKDYKEVFVIIKNPYEMLELQGKPLRIENNNTTSEIIIETERGYYNFDNSEILSVQFLR